MARSTTGKSDFSGVIGQAGICAEGRARARGGLTRFSEGCFRQLMGMSQPACPAKPPTVQPFLYRILPCGSSLERKLGSGPSRMLKPSVFVFHSIQCAPVGGGSVLKPFSHSGRSLLDAGRYAIALRAAGGTGASIPLIARHRISLSSKSSIRSYSLKSIFIDRSAP